MILSTNTNDGVCPQMPFCLANILFGGLHKVPVSGCGARFLERIAGPFCACLLFAAALFGASPAQADLKLCNTTVSRVGVVIGYKGKEGWVSEGWWSIPSSVCWTLIKGDLIARFYYVHAIDYDRPGVWDRNEEIAASKSEFYMCTEDKAFEIRGTSRCEARGFNRTRFFEVDTGDEKSWTITLQDKVEQRAKNQ